MFSAAAAADGAFQANKRDTFGPTVQAHRLRDISTATAVRAIVRVHPSPPQCGSILNEECVETGYCLYCVTNHEHNGEECEPDASRLM
jgi:hypothetical protein